MGTVFCVHLAELKDFICSAFVPVVDCRGFETACSARIVVSGLLTTPHIENAWMLGDIGDTE
jgi:hypothetical protein